MAIEIELKAWVDDPEALTARLNTLGKELKSYEKEDTYWVNAALNPAEIRIRKERDRHYPDYKTGRNTYPRKKTYVLVTFKEKHRDKGTGIETNEENEFTVSDGDTFSELLRRQGYDIAIVKRKKGRAWRCSGGGRGGILAELSMVEGLGWFVELEIVKTVDITGKADPDGDERLAEQRKCLLSLLEKLGIPESKIERRYYSEMLVSKK